VSVEHIEQATNVFREFLKKKDLKVTRQREILLRRIFETEEHFAAEDIEDLVKGDGISKATIYRTLQLLVEAGICEEVELGDNRRFYEHVFGHPQHDHIVCMDCKKIFEFDARALTDVENKITGTLGFKPVSHSLRIEATCDDLQENGVCNRTATRVL